MELIYMYIKNFGHKIEDNKQYIDNQEFNFSNKFNIKYDINTKELYIEKKINICPNFYGESIESIKMIVGKNGTGKSYILDILGMNKEDRISKSFITEYDSINSNEREIDILNPPKGKDHFIDEYIIIYLVEDNEELNKCVFGMEVVGNFREEPFIKNIKIKEGIFYKLPIGFIFKYTEDKKLEATGKHFFSYDLKSKRKSPDGDKLHEGFNIFYLSNNYSDRITYKEKREISYMEDDNRGYLFKRFYGNLNMDFPIDYKYGYILMNDKKYETFREGIFDFKPKIIFSYKFLGKKLSLSFGKDESDDMYYDVMCQLLDTQRFNEVYELEKKERVILNWIDDYLIHLFTSVFYEERDTKEILKKIKSDDIEDILEKGKSIEMEFIYINNMMEKFAEDNFKNRMDKEKITYFEYEVDYKLRMIDCLFLKLGDKYKVIETGEYRNFFKEIIKVIIKLDYKCFNDNMGINLTENEDSNIVIELLDLIDDYSEDKVSGISSFFSCELGNLSTGEEKIFVLFSKINSILEKTKNNHMNILLLDEPDSFLHPQWSRKFMDLLLTSIDLYSNEVEKINMQLIITTHSPFLLSDVRRDDIILLNDDSEFMSKVKIQDTNTDTFASNIHNMLNNTFFMDNTIGEFANKKIKFVIQNLMYVEEISENRKEEMKYIIELIGEPIIKRKLELMYNDRFLNNKKDYEVKIKNLERERDELRKKLENNQIDDIDTVMQLLEDKIKELKNKVGNSI